MKGPDFGRIAGFPEVWRIEAEEQPQILRRSASQDEGAGNCLFCLPPLAFVAFWAFCAFRESITYVFPVAASIVP